MGYFVHKTRITSSDALIKKLALYSAEVKQLRRKSKSDDFSTQRLAKLKLDKIAECVFETRRAHNGIY